MVHPIFAKVFAAKFLVKHSEHSAHPILGLYFSQKECTTPNNTFEMTEVFFLK